MSTELNSDDSLQLVRFLCSIAWADLQIRQEERDYIQDIIRRLDFDEEEAEQVERWLRHPPDPDDVDPGDIPIEHRELFLHHVLAVAQSDGDLAEVEQEAYDLLCKLIR